MDGTETRTRPDDRPDPTPWPVSAKVAPDWRWGSVVLWLWAASLGVAVGILYGVWAAVGVLHEIAQVLRAR